jgi:hypothetical protein
VDRLGGALSFTRLAPAAVECGFTSGFSELAGAPELPVIKRVTQRRLTSESTCIKSRPVIYVA